MDRTDRISLIQEGQSTQITFSTPEDRAIEASQCPNCIGIGTELTVQEVTVYSPGNHPILVDEDSNVTVTLDVHCERCDESFQLHGLLGTF